MPAPLPTPPAGDPPARTLARPAGAPSSQPEGQDDGLTKDSLLAMMAGQVLCESGYTGEQAAGYVAVALGVPMAERITDLQARVDLVTAAARESGTVADLNHARTVTRQFP